MVGQFRRRGLNFSGVESSELVVAQLTSRFKLTTLVDTEIDTFLHNNDGGFSAFDHVESHGQVSLLQHAHVPR